MVEHTVDDDWAEHRRVMRPLVGGGGRLALVEDIVRGWCGRMGSRHLRLRISEGGD